MGLCRVAVITALVVLLQCELQHAASCNGRKTIIQIKIPGNTNINVKFPPKSEPVKFVPYPNDDDDNGGCLICNGNPCRKCTTIEYQKPTTISQGKSYQKTNIIVDLRRSSVPENDSKNNDSGTKTPPSTGINNSSTGGIPPQDGTVVVLQDLSSASSNSNSSTSGSSKNGAQTAASSASSAAISDIIASFDPNSAAGGQSNNTEDIFVEDNELSTAGSTASSKVNTNSGPEPKTVPNTGTPATKTTSAEGSSLSTGNAIAKTANSGNSNNAAISESTVISNASSTGDAAISNAGAKSGAVTITGGESGDEKATSQTVVKTITASADDDESGDGAGTGAAISKAAEDSFDDFE